MSIFSRLNDWVAKNISHKLLVAFFLVFFGTYLATALVVLTAVRSSVVGAEHDALEQMASFKLNSLNTHFDQLRTDLHAWSKLDVMNDLASGDVDQRVARALEDMKADYALKGDLYAFNAAGQLIASSDNRRRNTLLPAAWRPGKAITFVDKHASPLDGSPIAALSTPVYSSFAKDLQLGTLVVTYPWSAVRETLAEQAMLLRTGTPPVILESTLRGVGGESVIEALGRTRPGDVWLQLGPTRYLAHAAANGSGRLLADWEVVVFRSPTYLNHTLSVVAWELAALCAVITLPLIMVIRWLANRLTAPLRDLTGFVAGITGTGDLSQRLAPTSRDELGTLTTAFNHMAGRLDAAAQERERFVRELEFSAQELEKKVQARTRELTAANAEQARILAELQSAQSQLIQQEKLASLGQLVAGVAHELNNPIGFIYANFPHLEEYVRTLLDVLDGMRQLPMSDEARAELERRLEEADIDYLRGDLLKIIRSGQSGATRIKDIISSLRSFSRLDEAVEKNARLEDGLDDTLALLRHHLQKRIEVVKDYRLNTAILCHPGQLNQVFMNILYNAIQAIEGPGTVTVSTRREEGWAVVAIADSGCGIPAETLGRIFDPFFTTKKVGEGTGLGLSISYGIVQNHGGRIEVDSAPGKGTTFTIRLPIDGKPASQPGS